jgi:hypothetical protein
VGSFLHLSILENDATVSILGERGSGKTTLLYFACARLLDAANDVVLPVIRPEHFARGDSLTGWVLAALERILVSDHSKALRSRFQETDLDEALPDSSLADALTRLRHREALVQGGYREALRRQPLSPYEFGRDAASVTSQGATFVELWRSFMDQVLPMITPSTTRPPLLVIPIDDADLRPSLLPLVFDEIRRLAAHPSVTVIMCASETTAQNALMSQYLLGGEGETRMAELIQLNMAPSGGALEVAARQLAKAMPEHLRVYLRPLSLRERLQFRPIDRSRSLIDVLKSIPGAPLVKIDTLGDYFAAPVSGRDRHSRHAIPLGYTNCFSASPRALDQLYRLLEAHASSDEIAERRFASAARAIVEHGLRSAAPLVPPEYRDPVRIYDDEGVVWIEPDFRDIDFGKQLGRGVRLVRRLPTGKSVTIALRSVTGLYAAPPEPLPSLDSDIADRATRSRAMRSGSDHRLHREFPDTYSHALMLAEELVGSGPIFNRPGRYGDVTTPGAARWDDVCGLTVDGMSTDNAFWVIPDWDDHLDYFLYIATWNELVTSVLHLVRQSPDNNEPYVEALFLMHVEAIWSITLRRRIPASLSRAVAALSTDDGEEVGAFANRLRIPLGRRLREAYAAGRAPDATVLEKDFVYWFSVLLPWAFDEISLPKATVDFCAALRHSILERHGDLASGNSRAAVRLARRIRERISEPWIASTIDVLAGLDPDLADEIRAEWTGARAEANDALRDFIDRLESAGVPEDIIERLRMQGLAEDVIRDLVPLGVSIDVLRRLQRSTIAADRPSLTPAPE